MSREEARSRTPGSFGRTLALGAVAATSLPLVLCVFQRLGASGAPRESELGLGLYWVVAAACSLAATAAPRRVRAVVPFSAFVLGLMVLSLSPGLAALAVALTFVVSVARSGFLLRQPPGRALVHEAVCGAASLGLAWALYQPTVFGAALSLWGWFLVQSCFYLLVEVFPRRPRPGQGDAFEVARARLLELLGPG